MNALKVNGRELMKTILRGDVEVLEKDRVRTKSGRSGIVMSLNTRRDTASVVWDDGEEFPIKCVHLEVLMRNAEIPARFSKKLPS